METKPHSRERRVAQLSQRRGITTKVAVLYEDRLEIRTSSFLGDVRSALELDALEGITHVRGANMAVTLALAATLIATFAAAIAVLLGSPTPADLRMLSALGMLSAVLIVLFAAVREDTFRIETFRRGRFSLFADREPDTAVIEFLGAVRRTRQRYLTSHREAMSGHSIADEIRKLAGLVSENVLSPEEFYRKKRDLLELEGGHSFTDAEQHCDELGEDEGPKSIN